MKLRIRYLVEEKNLVYVACHVAGQVFHIVLYSAQNSARNSQPSVRCVWGWRGLGPRGTGAASCEVRLGVFSHRCQPGFQMISISSCMMRVLSCMCCARRLYRALTFCWLLHAGTHGCHARGSPLRARRCGATDGRATRNAEGELSAAGARYRPSLCASRHVTSKEEPRQARGVSCLRMRPNYDAERHVGGVAHL